VCVCVHVCVCLSVCMSDSVNAGRGIVPLQIMVRQELCESGIC
jgi:hypothetical protein